MSLQNKRIEQPVIVEYPTYVNISARVCADGVPDDRLSVDIPRADLEATNDQAEYLKGRLNIAAQRVWQAMEERADFAASERALEASLRTILPEASALRPDPEAPTGLSDPEPITLPEPEPDPEPTPEPNVVVLDLGAAIATLPDTAVDGATLKAALAPVVQKHSGTVPGGTG